MNACSLLHHRFCVAWNVVALLLFFVVNDVAAATKVGNTQLARGLVSASGAQSTARLIGTGSPIFEGDVVTTGPRSSAILRLADDTRIMIRPNSSFQVEEFSVEESKPRAVMRLFKGGLRAVTGFISKRNPNAMRLRTAVATIGIRGTELDVRFCGTDCAEEAKARPAPSGRVGFAKGSVVAYAASGRARSLKTGYPLFNGERVVTSASSYTVLGFRDGGRITVLPNSEFKVERFEYVAEAPEQGRSFFRLVRGGLRAVTGAIGKARRSRYRMGTPVATIGIRGTAYDLLCQGTCANPGASPDPSGDGLFVDVGEGGVDFDGANPANAGETVQIGSLGAVPTPVGGMPQSMEVALPATLTIPTEPQAEPPAQGLYVSCYQGNCSLSTSENTVELEAGNAGFVGEGGNAAALDEIPAFQAEDPIYQALEAGGSIDPLGDLLDEGNIQCIGP